MWSLIHFRHHFGIRKNDPGKIAPEKKFSPVKLPPEIRPSRKVTSRKISTTNITLKSGLHKKDFLSTIFQSKILIKTKKPDASSFYGFSKKLEDITVNGSLTDSPWHGSSLSQ